MADRTADEPIQQMEAEANDLLAALSAAMQPTIDALHEFARVGTKVADEILREFAPMLRKLERTIRRHETLRAQMRRKGRPGWRHWRSLP